LELCAKIGYCQRGRFTLPVDDEKRQAWFDMAGMNVNAYDQTNSLNDKKKKHYLAYWHFPPERHQPHQHTGGRRAKHFDFLVPCNPLLGFRDEVRATRRGSERDDSAKRRRTMLTSPSKNDLERAFVEFERAGAAEADAAALRAEEQTVLTSAGCKTMVELAAKLQNLKDASSDFNAALASELVLVEAPLEKSASNREKAARTRWVNWQERNSDWETNQGKHAALRSLALETLTACDAARTPAGRLGVY
jgi:hypothetical protein